MSRTDAKKPRTEKTIYRSAIETRLESARFRISLLQELAAAKSGDDNNDMSPDAWHGLWETLTELEHLLAFETETGTTAVLKEAR